MSGLFASSNISGPHTVRAAGTDTLYSLKHPAANEDGQFGGEVGPSPITSPPNGDNYGQGQNQQGNSQGNGSNVFVNDPCLKPPPPSRQRTVTSETALGVYGRYMVSGYNNSFGFYDNTRGLSGFAYSVDAGRRWIDGGGLPPVVADHSPFGTLGSDHYAGDPVIVVDKSMRTFTGVTQSRGEFYYSSIYITPNGFQTLAVNRGHFEAVSPQTPESNSNTRCEANPALSSTPDTNNLPSERIVWDKPVVAVTEAELSTPGPDSLDKEWLTINPANGELYLTYTRFGADGSTPLELVRSKDGGRTWSAPSIIVPNLDDAFNQATQSIVTKTGRVVVTWYSRKFLTSPPFTETQDSIQYAYSDTDGATFGPTTIMSVVNPQGEPPGYNRNRSQILDAPYIAGNGTDVYVTYFSGASGSPTVPGSVPGPRPSNIFLSSSHDNAATFSSPVKVNDDNGQTSHIFPSAQVTPNGKVYVDWQDRRLDPTNNVLTDTWAASSDNSGASFDQNVRVSTVSASWFVRADARPNFGDYNSSALGSDGSFLMVWADGRFPPGTYIPPTCSPAPAPGQTCPPRLAATPNVLFDSIGGQNGQGSNGGGNSGGN